MRPILGEVPAGGRQAPLKIIDEYRVPALAGPVSALPRSRAYLDRLASLDAGVAEAAEVTAVIEAVEAEFGLAARPPLGLLAQCYLGSPYEVHVLDLADGVVRHYKLGETMDVRFEAARRLALHPAYVAIEVYADRLVCIHVDGRVSEIKP
jgi:hypothetical protein